MSRRHQDPLVDSSEEDVSPPRALSSDASPLGLASTVAGLEPAQLNESFPQQPTLRSAQVVTPPPQAALPAVQVGAAEVTQVVASSAEGDALVKQIRRLETENLSLSANFARICSENSAMVDRFESLHARFVAEQNVPHSDTSVLKALFNKDEHAGWLQGGKSETKTKLQETLQTLQDEFISYKRSHVSSIAEVSSLVTELKSSTRIADELSGELTRVKQSLLKPPYAMTIRIVSERDTLQSLTSDLAAMRQRHEALQREFGGVTSSVQSLTAENKNLVAEKLQLRAANEQLMVKLEAASRPLSPVPGAQDSAEVQQKVKSLQSQLDAYMLHNTQISTLLDNAQTEKRDLMLMSNTTSQQLQQTRTDLETLRLASTKNEASFTKQLTESEHLLKQKGVEQKQREEQLLAETDRLEERLEEVERRLTSSEKKAAALRIKLHTLNDSAKVSSGSRPSTPTSTPPYRRSDDDEKLISQLQSQLLHCKEMLADYEARLEATVSLQNFLAMEVELHSAKDALLLEREQHALNIKRIAEESNSGERELFSEIERLQQEKQEAELQVDKEGRAQIEAERTVAQNEVKKLKLALQQLTVQTVHLGEKSASLEAELREKQASSDDASQSRDEVGKQSQHFAKERADLKSQLEASNAANSQLQKKLLSHIEIIAQMEIDRESTISLEDFSTSESEKNKLSDENEILRTKIQRSEEAIQAFEKELQWKQNELQTEKKDAQVREEKLRHDYQAAISDMKQKFAEAVQEQQQQVAAAPRSAPQASTEETGQAKLELDALYSKYNDTLQAKTKNEQQMTKRIASLESELKTEVASVRATEQARATMFQKELEQAHKFVASLKLEIEQHKSLAAAPVPVVVDGSGRASVGAAGGAAGPPSTAAKVKAPLDPMPDSSSDTTAIRNLKKTVRQDFVPASKFYQVKCDNDKYVDQIKKMNVTLKLLDEEHQQENCKRDQKLKQCQHDLAELRQARGKGTSVAGTISTVANTATTAGQASLDALRQMNDKLLSDKEELDHRLGMIEAENTSLRTQVAALSAATAAQPSGRPQSPAAAAAPLDRLSSPMFHTDRELIEKTNEIAFLKQTVEELTLSSVEKEKKTLDQQQLNAKAAATFQQAMNKSDSELAALQAKIAALEAEIANLRTAAVAQPAPTKKVLRKKKGILDSSDIATDESRLTPPPPGIDPALLESLETQIEASTNKLALLSHQIASLQKENMKLKEDLLATTAELSAAKDELKDAQDSHADEVERLTSQVQSLSAKAKRAVATPDPQPVAPVRPVSPAKVEAAAPPSPSSSTAAADVAKLRGLIAEHDARSLTQQAKIGEQKALIQKLHDAVVHLEGELESTQHQLQNASSKKVVDGNDDGEYSPRENATKSPQQRGKSTSPSGGLTVTDLQRQIAFFEQQVEDLHTSEAELTEENQRLKSELDAKKRQKPLTSASAVTEEFIVMKAKLAEYVAVTDRLGIAYPFPTEFETCAKVRMSGMQFESTQKVRSGSAPATARRQGRT